MGDDAREARADAKASKARAKALRPWWKRKRVLIPVGIVVLIAIGGALGGGDEDDKEPTEQAADAPQSVADDAESTNAAGAEEQPATDRHAIGDTATSSDFAITVHGITDPYEPTNEFISPPDGERWVAADVTVENTDDERAPFSTMLGLELFDVDGRAWTMTITGDNLPGLDGDVQPGEKRRGTTVFAVPADTVLSHLVVKGSMTAAGARFDL